MAAKMSVLGLILSSYPYLSSAMVRFPLKVKEVESKEDIIASEADKKVENSIVDISKKDSSNDS